MYSQKINLPKVLDMDGVDDFVGAAPGVDAVDGSVDEVGSSAGESAEGPPGAKHNHPCDQQRKIREVTKLNSNKPLTLIKERLNPRCI